MTPTPRRAAAALLALAIVLLAPAPARADPPERLATQVTDSADALGSGRAAVDSALAKLQTDTGLQLFVVFVDSFDGTAAQEWTDRTAKLSDLGQGDALLAVATRDRAYAYSFPEDDRFTDRELSEVAESKIEPPLSRSDWSAAVVAATTGYEDAANGSGAATLIWVLVILVAIIAAALIWVVIRRNRRRGAAPGQHRTTGPAPVTTEALTAEANALLIELDDDLRASERELELAAAQYGTDATAQFRAALEASRQDVAEAFRLRMTLDETPPPDEPTRRSTLTAIIERCKTADARLDAESEDFDRLRDLEGRAAEVADDIDRRRVALEAALPAAAAALQDLNSRYAGPTVTAVSTNLEQARERLTFTADALHRARAALAGTVPTAGDHVNPTPVGPGLAAPIDPGLAGLGLGGEPGAAEFAAAARWSPAADGDPADAPASTNPADTRSDGNAVPGGDRAEAALAVRAAEQAIDQAEQLVAAVHRAGTDLAAARTAADALISEVESEIAAGRAALNGAGAIPPGLGSAVTGAEQTLTEVRTALADARPDPVAAAAHLQAADAELDRALAEARDTAERAARARSLLAQALPVARAEVAAAGDFITTRRGAVDAGARASLSEAQRHLALAESLADSDPATAVTEAQQAQSLAASAGHSARADVQNWDGYSTGYGRQGGGFDAGSFAGAVLGGILAGGSRGSRGGGYGGGWSGGGFGGSASRGRRTGGGGGGGGRRGGGGRF